MNQFRKPIAIALSLSLTAALLGGCGSNGAETTVTEQPAETPIPTEAIAPTTSVVSDETVNPSEELLENTGAEETEEEEEAENYDTGDASLDDPLNQDGIGETELLVVSFGTSFNDNRRETIGAIERAMIQAFPDMSVRRGFTSQIIIDHVLRRDGEIIDNMTEALERAMDNGVKNLVVQPTHLMDGFEYNDVVAEVAAYSDAFQSVSIGRPVLDTPEDFSVVAETITGATAEYDDGSTAICFMGHGTEAQSNGVYAQMQQVLRDMGKDNYFIGTVEAEPSVEDVLELVQAGEYTRVVLEPLMIVAGDHANNDMAGDDADSWKTIFQDAGYEVAVVLRGLGEFEEIQALLVDHARDAAGQPEAASTAAGVAGPEDMTAVEDVVEAGMTPVSAAELQTGTWPVEMKSSSSMFKADHCDLVVTDSGMEAVLYMNSESYAWMFAGTAQEAAEADTSAYIPLENHSFTLPIPALDAGIPCAAFSVRKELWYDRTLLFRSDSLPLEAFATLETVESLGLSDGDYTVAVALSGGSGKATVASPARMTVKDGAAEVELVWSSPNYDYMKLEGEQYLPVNPDGNSTFLLPVPAFDRAISVLADTTAMSQPYEIAYTLTFDAGSVQAAQG